MTANQPILLQNFNNMKNNLWLKLILLSSALILVLFFTSTNLRAQNTLLARVRGRILLQVEENGEAWYVHPDTDERYYLGRPQDAFDLMKQYGLGISNADIAKIPLADANLGGLDSDQDGLSDIIENAIGTNIGSPDTDNDGYSDKTEIILGYNPNGSGTMNIDDNFTAAQNGKILIQVEQNGEAWYVNPVDSKRYFLGRPQDAFNIMRKLGLGITNQNLTLVPEIQLNPNNNTYLIANFTQPVPEKNLRIFSDEKYKFSFSYPDAWQIEKPFGHNNIIFLGDYEKDVFKEKKAVIYITYIQNKKDISVSDMTIAEKEGAVKESSQSLEINGMAGLQEVFTYQKAQSYEDNTYLQISPNEILQLNLATTGDVEYYLEIYNNLLQSIEITQ